MEDQTFDQLARESAGAPTRRTLVRGLAAALGAAGVGLGVGLDAEAKKSKKQKRKQRKKKQKQKEKNYECDYKDRVCETPLNPCQQVTCENHKCVTSNVTDGTTCGADLVCEAGACVCPNGVCTVRVSSSSLSNWLGYNDVTDTVNNSILDFVTGPGTPPYGPGSVEIIAPAGSRYNVATYQFAGTRLADLTTLRFTTYNASDSNQGSPNNSGYLHFNVDFYGSDTWQRRLVYVPSANGTVTQDTWQEWNAIDPDALWLWSNFTGDWPGGGTQKGDEPKTWSEILSDYPDARFRVTDAFFGVRVGEPYPDDYTENINSVTFGTSTGTTRFVFGPPS